MGKLLGRINRQCPWAETGSICTCVKQELVDLMFSVIPSDSKYNLVESSSKGTSPRALCSLRSFRIFRPAHHPHLTVKVVLHIWDGTICSLSLGVNYVRKLKCQPCMEAAQRGNIFDITGTVFYYIITTPVLILSSMECIIRMGSNC